VCVCVCVTGERLVYHLRRVRCVQVCGCARVQALTRQLVCVTQHIAAAGS
jgi:hypothetical protein